MAPTMRATVRLTGDRGPFVLPGLRRYARSRPPVAGPGAQAGAAVGACVGGAVGAAIGSGVGKKVADGANSLIHKWWH